MPITFACACGKKLSVSDEKAGMKGKCPACKQPIQIPGKPGKGEFSAPPTRATVTIEVRCACGKGLTVPAHMAGKTVPCEECGRDLQVPKSGDSGPGSKLTPPEERKELHSLNYCPSCNGFVSRKDALCMSCGTNLVTGQKMSTVVEKPPKRLKDYLTPQVKGMLGIAGGLLVLLGIGAWWFFRVPEVDPWELIPAGSDGVVWGNISELASLDWKVEEGVSGHENVTAHFQGSTAFYGTVTRPKLADRVPSFGFAVPGNFDLEALAGSLGGVTKNGGKFFKEVSLYTQADRRFLRVRPMDEKMKDAPLVMTTIAKGTFLLAGDAAGVDRMLKRWEGGGTSIREDRQISPLIRRAVQTNPTLWVVGRGSGLAPAGGEGENAPPPIETFFATVRTSGAGLEIEAELQCLSAEAASGLETSFRERLDSLSSFLSMLNPKLGELVGRIQSRVEDNLLQVWFHLPEEMLGEWQNIDLEAKEAPQENPENQ